MKAMRQEGTPGTDSKIVYGAEEEEKERERRRQKVLPSIQEEIRESMKIELMKEMAERAKLRAEIEERKRREKGQDYSKPQAREVEPTESDLEDEEGESRYSVEDIELMRQEAIADAKEGELFDEFLEWRKKKDLDETLSQPKGMTLEEKSEVETSFDKLKRRMEDLRKGLEREWKRVHSSPMRSRRQAKSGLRHKWKKMRE